METKTVSRIRENMPGLFSNFFKPWNEWLNDDFYLNAPMNLPAVNVTQTDKAYHLEMAVPGLNKKDFNLEIDGNLLTISNETKNETEEKNEKYTRKEFNYSSFRRTFTLPDEVDKGKIDAKYEDGILRISLPFGEQVKKADTKQIPIQ